VDGRVVSSDVMRGIRHVTIHNTPIHNILSTAQLSISQKALGTLPEDSNVMPKHVVAILVFKLSPCCINVENSSGYFTGV